jgi:glutamine synthetase
LEDEKSLEFADQTYIKEDASSMTNARQLPASCFEAAEELLKDRKIYEKNGIFPAEMIDKLAKDLKAHQDKDLSEKLFGNADALKAVVNQFIHCG